ncbi:DUF2283 domain-containing protein [Corynebacterium mastitidis]|uniref:DUF2283 domain-containing protein n=1 Tax=Corynebacterium mastitidis TaxID=161890 RepID=A0A2N0X7S9_9CORY|nr:DUF2283 domain-containing protein [Corynebacterium mastitidis]MCH6196233.1 DUF2283 domain-containing protein [Corynebacterium mastitidis]PKF68766.1 hypothetical protein CXB45_05265 [Corynebacterium mastitidis]
MKFESDLEADVAYLLLAGYEETSEKQISGISIDRMDGEIAIDLNGEGRVIGIDFVGASYILPVEMIGKK